jgi:hypothetical protein
MENLFTVEFCQSQAAVVWGAWQKVENRVRRADYRAADDAIPALGHDASICEMPHVRHSKIYRSVNPPKRFVSRTSIIR